MEGAGVAGPCTHAQADFGRKPRCPDLAGAKGHGLEQGVLPIRQFGVGLAMGPRCRSTEHVGQALQIGAGQGGQPGRVQRAGHQQRKQLGGVRCLRGHRQQFVVQALHKLADKGIS